MPISNFAAITALALTMYNEIPKFIRKQDEEIDLYYVLLSVIISSLWTYYHFTNNNSIGKIGAMLFLTMNLVLLFKCLQRRKGFSSVRTSPSE